MRTKIDTIVVGLCNFILKHFASKEYVDRINLLMELGIMKHKEMVARQALADHYVTLANKQTNIWDAGF